jgi:hypothetical protein
VPSGEALSKPSILYLQLTWIFFFESTRKRDSRRGEGSGGVLVDVLPSLKIFPIHFLPFLLCGLVPYANMWAKI